MYRLLLAALVSFLVCQPAAAVDRTAVDRAIARGVAALKQAQQADGTWNYTEIGMTALAGLTLVECGEPKDGAAVKKAAEKVREAGLAETKTYSLALAVLFLDRLDNPADTPLIESMIVRLLAGQTSVGGWGYTCPRINEEEMKRIRGEMDTTRVLRAGRDLSKLKEKGKRTAEDLPREIQQQLQLVARAAVGFEEVGAVGGDNSNTQFATLALWVGRRYGVPTQPALLRVDKRFRASQGADGGWGYTLTDGMRGGGKVIGYGGGSTAAMTCAGLLGLACGHGAAVDVKKAKDAKVDSSDASKDANLKAGLQLLSTAVGRPIGWKGDGVRPAVIPVASGKAYYFLWSLERVCVVLSLETIGKKNWYDWGAEILLASQHVDGSWSGEYPIADTCFALMFLKRVNLARDLTSSIRGLRDPGEKVLRAGGVGGAALKGGGDALRPTDIGGRTSKPGSPTEKAPPTGAPPKPPDRDKPPPRSAEERAAGKLADDLVKGGERRAAALRELRDSKGVAYTEALVAAIGRLDGTARRQAREALAERLARMRATTLKSYFQDDEPEIRRAAALAAAAREARELVGDLIGLLNDTDPLVERAAYAALKDLTGKDFGPPAGANRAARDKAVTAWRAWWKQQRRE